MATHSKKPARPMKLSRVDFVTVREEGSEEEKPAIILKLHDIEEGEGGRCDDLNISLSSEDARIIYQEFQLAFTPEPQ